MPQLRIPKTGLAPEHGCPVPVLFLLRRWLLILAMTVSPAWSDVGEPAEQAAASEPAEIQHEIQQIEGWTVHVDRRLLHGEHEATGKKALRILANQLHDIALVVPANRVERLREVPIWVDLDHRLGNLQYHPSIGWLRDNGHAPAMARAVHVPQARRLIELAASNAQPWVMLHELAHAYHDRVLGFDWPPIQEAYQKIVASGRYESVLHIGGRKIRHYALTDHKEFFAEMSESYFGTNDFYPFVRAELQDYDPEVFDLLRRVWHED
ncbi:MAG: metallopeptidase [Pirellulaceae bacterium]|nr:metallopeptidase [Pirellulaceae bacterium]